ncbi:hypothetical protein [Phenylobacterium deserti]|nr:hypothetical protein [Phenylobacterium deserti]
MDLIERRLAEPACRKAPVGLPWIQVAQGAPYFVDETGADFTPIGQNDAISWVELEGLFRRRDLAAVERHLVWLRDHGVTVLRLMMEYAQVRTRYFERPAGRFNPTLVQLWDDLFAMCERVGLRILLTPFDTFWTWLHWRHHPYNAANGGPLDHPSRLLLCGATRELIKARLRFAAARWGGSGALFAWDLWNEIHPAQAQDSADNFNDFIADLSAAVREEELRRFGRSHPQTVSLFGPELTLKPHLDLAGPIYRHPDLDFANLHIYATGTIDDPKNTVAPPVAMGRIIRGALTEIQDSRPFFDSEHGPIHTFKDRKRTLPEPFDDEYFRHLQWAHLASGGAGGGMRWPNRHPHVLTPGMRRAQASLSRFTPLIDWSRFRRRNLNQEIVTTHTGLETFGCGDDRQALVWLLRRGPLADGQLDAHAPPIQTMVRVPGLAARAYEVTAWNTAEGRTEGSWRLEAGRGALMIPTPPFVADLALAVRPAA